MNTRIILAALAGAVSYFLLGWLVYGILLMGYYEAHTTQYAGLMKEMPNLFLIFLSNLVMAFLMAVIFGMWANFKTFVKGMTGGMVISFLTTLSFDLYFLAAYNLFSGAVTVVDIIVSTIMGGIIGGIIGWILGIGSKPITTS